MASNPNPPDTRPTSLWIWAALVAAVIVAVGSVYLTLQLKLKPCALCYYQRTFAFSLVAVLAVGLLGRVLPTDRLGVLALPLALSGLGVAVFHVWLEVSGKLECPEGVFGLGTAPKQSLAGFVILSVLLIGDVIQGMRAGAVRLLGVLLALLVSAGLVWASCKSNPPLPSPPDKEYPGPPDVCRVPYRAPTE
jgi:disulfide bond formation protein DsbB